MVDKYRSIREEIESRGIALDPNELVAVERIEALVEGVHATAGAIGRAFRSLTAGLTNRLREANARRELANLTDRELADIGLNRSDVYRKDLYALGRERAESARRAETKTEPANENRSGRAAA
jgi:uncharacterized protein YjiS (DUF1127 family)